MVDKILDQMFVWGHPILVLCLGIILGWLIKRFVHSRFISHPKIIPRTNINIG